MHIPNSVSDITTSPLHPCIKPSPTYPRIRDIAIPTRAIHRDRMHYLRPHGHTYPLNDHMHSVIYVIPLHPHIPSYPLHMKERNDNNELNFDHNMTHYRPMVAVGRQQKTTNVLMIAHVRTQWLISICENMYKYVQKWLF